MTRETTPQIKQEEISQNQLYNEKVDQYIQNERWTHIHDMGNELY